MTVMFLMADCIRCGRMFMSNPDRVPTIRDEAGVKQPLCQSCHTAIQTLQRDMNLPVWPDPLPGAYEPVDVDRETFYESD